MIHEIAKITGLAFDAANPATLQVLRRIERKMPLKVNVNLMDKKFINQVKEAKKQVDAEGDEAFHLQREAEASVAAAQIAKEPHVYKIKPSLKGKRISVADPVTGVRYAFGPVWCESIRVGKGCAFSKTARGKLDYHAYHLGLGTLAKLAKLDTKEVVKLVAAELAAVELAEQASGAND